MLSSLVVFLFDSAQKQRLGKTRHLIKHYIVHHQEIERPQKEREGKKGGKIVSCSSSFLMDKPHEEMLSLGMERAELGEGILVDTI